MISGQVVEATWRDSASLSPAEGRRVFEGLTKRQPALLAFVLFESESLTRGAAELVNYLFFVILRMFYAGSPEIRSVSLEETQSCAVEVETGVASLEGAHEKFLERAARVLSGRQPHVFRYLTEAIMEPSDDGDSLELTADDQGGIFLILATVIKALDEKGLPESTGRD